VLSSDPTHIQPHQMAHFGVSLGEGLKLFGREIIFEEFQPM